MPRHDISLPENRVRSRIYAKLWREFQQGALTWEEYRQESEAVDEYQPREAGEGDEGGNA